MFPPISALCPIKLDRFMMTKHDRFMTWQWILALLRSSASLPYLRLSFLSSLKTAHRLISRPLPYTISASQDQETSSIPIPDHCELSQASPHAFLQLPVMRSEGTRMTSRSAAVLSGSCEVSAVTSGYHSGKKATSRPIFISPEVSMG